MGLFQSKISKVGDKGYFGVWTCGMFELLNFDTAPIYKSIKNKYVFAFTSKNYTLVHLATELGKYGT